MIVQQKSLEKRAERVGRETSCLVWSEIVCAGADPRDEQCDLPHLLLAGARGERETREQNQM